MPIPTVDFFFLTVVSIILFAPTFYNAFMMYFSNFIRIVGPDESSFILMIAILS